MPKRDYAEMEAAAAPGLSGNKLSRHVKEVIVHMHEHCGLSAPKIAPLIPSPRSLEAGASVAVSVVYKVLAHKATYGNVFEKPRKAVDRKMTKKHARMLICVITERPFLYLDEIARELETFSGVLYSSKLCYTELRRRKYSLKAMRRRAAQRNDFLRFKYWEEMSDLMVHPWQVCFIDEVGQDGRGSRRRRGWGPVGEDVVISEYLNRGKHISMLALYGYEGFLSFDHLEGGYKADDFLAAVKFCVVPFLQPYDKANPRPNSILVLDNCR